MLILGRGREQCVVIGDNIKVMVTHIGRKSVKLGVTAPKTIPVHREEVWKKIESEKENKET